MKIKMDVIVPDKLFDTDKLQRVIRNQLTEAAAAAKVDFGVTTQTWTHKPKFRTRWINNCWGREVFTDDEIYFFLNNGTRKNYPIPKTPGKTLAFQANYKAKTVVRSISSSSGGSSGKTVFARQVIHPGIDARHFDEEIAKKWRKELPVQLQRAIDAEV